MATTKQKIMINKLFKILLLNFLSFFYLGTIAVSGQSISTEWSKQISGSQSESGGSITIGKSGNIYQTGSFSDSLFFNVNGNTELLISKGIPGSDSYLSKFDQNGDMIWIKHFAGNFFCHVASIAVDDDENIYLTGSFADTAWLDHGNVPLKLVSTGEIDAFICKVNNNGIIEWAKQIGGIYRTEGTSITVDKFGSIFYTGMFRGTVDFDPGIATYNLTSEGGFGSSDIFIAKLDTDGNFGFAKQFKGNFGEVSTAITADSVGNIYITGHFTQTVDFDPGVSTFELQAQNGADAFIAKLQNDGDFIWAMRIGGPGTSSISDIKIDENNLYVVGTFQGVTDFDPSVNEYLLSSQHPDPALNGNNDFICKLTANGDFIWVNKLTSGWSSWIRVFIKAHQIYVSGQFAYPVDFDPTNSVMEVTPSGYVDIFVAIYGEDSELKSVRTFGGAGLEFDGVSSIGVDMNDNVFITGSFEGNLNFDNIGLSTNFNSDIYITKFKNISTKTNDLAENNIFAWPNPSTGLMVINLDGIAAKNIKIFNSMGKCIQNNNLTNTTGDYNVDLSGHSSGTYFLQISTDLGFEICKIIKY